MLTPVEVQGDEWSTTDLFLDVALIPGLPPMILDEDELDKARDEGWLDAGTGARAEEEARRLLAEAEAGRWPPPVVDEWPLSRVRAVEGVAP